MNIHHALDMVRLCREAKEPVLEETPTRKVITLGADLVTVTAFPAFVAVVFRSSDNRSGWLNNFRAIRHPPTELTPHGRMHKGFWIAGSALLAPIRDMVDELLQGRYKPVAFAGHSRGGALAMFAAFALREVVPDVLSVTTFGAPRWCDKVLAREYDMALGSRTIKFVNNNDVVPHLPPWKFGWQHVGRMAYIDRKGAIHADAHALPWWDRLLGRFESGKLLDGIHDHSGDNLSAYLLPIEAAAAKTDSANAGNPSGASLGKTR